MARNVIAQVCPERGNAAIAAVCVESPGLMPPLLAAYSATTRAQTFVIFRSRAYSTRQGGRMNTRLLNLALATVWLASFQGVAWAQHHGHAGGGGGARHPQGSTGITSRREARDGSRENHPAVITTPPSVVVPPGMATNAGARLFFAQPYYVFRPRASVGLGLFLGFPVGYPNPYFYARQYPYPYPYYYYSAPTYYPYPSSVPFYPGYTTIVPGATAGSSSSPAAAAPNAVGGVSFQITPGDAAIFVDGAYVGTANDFSAMRPPLSLAAGRHHFELRAQGYQTMAFDVEVRADWVVPYQGVLQPQP